MQKVFSYLRLKNPVKFLLYSRYYAEACNEWRGPSPRLSAWATQLRRNIAAVATQCPIRPARESNPKPTALLAMCITTTSFGDNVKSRKNAICKNLRSNGDIEPTAIKHNKFSAQIPGIQKFKWEKEQKDGYVAGYKCRSTHVLLKI